MLRIDKYFQLCGVSGLCCNDLTQFCSVLFSPSFTEVYLMHKNLHIKKNLFCIGILLINNFVIVSCGQQRDSAIHMHVSILPQTPFPGRLPSNTEFHVPYRRSLLVIHFKYSMYMSITNSLTIPSLILAPASLATVSSFSKSVSLFHNLHIFNVYILMSLMSQLYLCSM